MCAFKGTEIKHSNFQNIQRNQDMSILYACYVYKLYQLFGEMRSHQRFTMVIHDFDEITATH